MKKREEMLKYKREEHVQEEGGEQQWKEKRTCTRRKIWRWQRTGKIKRIEKKSEK